MTRLPDRTFGGAVVGGACAVVLVGSFLVSSGQDSDERPPAATVDPYDHCIAAANHPTSGFATEVCEPLAPGWEEPAVLIREGDFRLDGCVEFRYTPASPEPIVYCPQDAGQEATP